MLVLSRKVGSGVLIGSDILVTLEVAKGNRVILRITAPRNRSIRRSNLVPKPRELASGIGNLVLTLRIGESLIIDETIKLVVQRKSGTFRFGINAPRNVNILRTELDERQLT